MLNSILLQKVLRISTLCALLFRILLRNEMTYTMDVISYILLSVSLFGMVLIGIVVYIQKRKAK